MKLIRPFAALRPTIDQAQYVAAPPYDVLSSKEAAVLTKEKPLSFLHISKPEIDLPEGTDLYSDQVYQKGLENLNKMIEKGVLKQDSAPTYYVYRMIDGDHEQTGLVLTASAKAYSENLIRKHELTRPDKENDRLRHIDTLNAQISPVLLTCRPSKKLSDILKETSTGDPVADVVMAQDVRHTLWKINESEVVDQISDLFNVSDGSKPEIDRLYIADGHHRSAAATRIYEQRSANNSEHTGDENYNFFLSVVYPSNTMKILDYNRVVRDLNRLSTSEFLTEIKQSFNIEKMESPFKPAKPKEMGMYLEGSWYKLTLKAGIQIPSDPSERLDVSLIYQFLLLPVLGIKNQRTDKRIDFVGGIRGLEELERRVNSGEMKAAFSFYPTQMEQIIDVADNEQIMPPKSTWFEPKLVDGLISYML